MVGRRDRLVTHPSRTEAIEAALREIAEWARLGDAHQCGIHARAALALPPEPEAAPRQAPGFVRTRCTYPHCRGDEPTDGTCCGEPFTSPMAEAAERYLRSVGPHAHPLPAQFRWVDCFRAMLAARPAPDAVRSQWLPIETAPKERKLIVGLRTSLGMWRTALATYYGPESLFSEEEDEYVPEGWYEYVYSVEEQPRLAGQPTHWMPLPPPPEREAQQAGEQR